MSRIRAVAGKDRHLSGWKKEPGDHRDLEFMVARHVAQPSKVEMLQNLSPVWDQGQVGDCVCNSSLEAMQYLERKGAADLLYSRLYLYYYGRAAEGTPPGEDSGMFIRTAMKVLKARGVCTDATWNYDNAEMRFTQKPPTAADLEAAQHKALSYYRCVDLYTIKSSLIHGYPVVFGFSVPENMESPQCAVSGMVLYPGSSESIIGGHAVLAVGYDDSIVIGSSIGAVLCQNSWGTSWGLSGFFYLPYRFFYDGLASDCWTIRKAQV